MAKIANMKERVHQPFRDILVRASGYETPNPQVQQTGQLFIRQNANVGETNLPQGSQLPSDNSLVILGIRCFLWFRKSEPRQVDGSSNVVVNGDFLPSAFTANASAAAGTQHDVLRLYYQASEQIFWSVGTGEKNSIKQMPSSYFPWGGGLHGDLGGCTDLMIENNGMPDHTGILRLARAIVLPPRQAIQVQYQISNLIPQTANTLTASLTQGTRNMMDIQGNLNAVDLVQKTVALALDGLLSRDVQ